MVSNIKNYSISPEGEEFPLPEPEEYKEEFKRIKVLVDKPVKKEKKLLL